MRNGGKAVYEIGRFFYKNMIRYIVPQTEDGKTLERILLSHFKIERNGFYKALRKKEIKINGRRIADNRPLRTDDVIEAYIVIRQDGKGYETVYENPYILIVNKKQGVPVAEDGHREYTLAAQVDHDFGAGYALCHRIDRNTGGLVLFSKQKAYTERIIDAFNKRYYNKIYQCITAGDARGSEGVHTAWHFKDSGKNRVYIYPAKKKYTKEILTEILTVQYDAGNDTSKLEINLITGRTHQIRAHLAFLGLPVVGDGKYGSNAVNRKFAYRYQALWACKLIPHDADPQLAEILPCRTISVNPAYE